MKKNGKDIFHLGYHIILLIKGIDGILEMIGGFLMIYLNPQRMDKLIVSLTQHELLDDPNDTVANALVEFGHNFSINKYTFEIIYLIIHGFIKVILISLLWRKKLWAYPLCILVFGLFVVYQIYRFTLTYSLLLVLLTVFDLLMIYMTYIEYKQELAKVNDEIELDDLN